MIESEHYMEYETKQECESVGATVTLFGSNQLNSKWVYKFQCHESTGNINGILLLPQQKA